MVALLYFVTRNCPAVTTRAAAMPRLGPAPDTSLIQRQARDDLSHVTIIGHPVRASRGRSRSGAPSSCQWTHASKGLSHEYASGPDFAARGGTSPDGAQRRPAEGLGLTERNVDPSTLTARVTGGLAGRLAQGSVVIPGNGPDRPDLIFLDPQLGVVLVEFDGGSDPGDRQPYVRLNRKAQELVSALPQLADIRPAKAVIFRGCEQITAQPNGSETRALGFRDAENGSWWETLPPQPLALDQFDDLVESLAPELQFHVRGRQGAEDPGAAERAHWRVRLDAEQAIVATGQLNDVLLLDGPPGSGKTLALAARARWLASQHPDWHIQVLCFNSALVPYLCGSGRAGLRP